MRRSKANYLKIFFILIILVVVVLLSISKHNKAALLKTSIPSKISTRYISQTENNKIAYKESGVCEKISYNKNLGDAQKNIGYQNNKFGLYIYAEEDYVELAGDLANSNGGDWGYVLIPINVKDYDGTKWKKIFRLLNQKRLIPILQLWDLSKEDERGQLEESAKFLNSMEWPIKNRYISVFNEPNDSSFWREKASPKEYAQILDTTISLFKEENPDFFMLNGAFNASARNALGYVNEEDFLIGMDDAVPGIFKKLDGWASHPYPQPNFSGNPRGVGRDSIRAYEWELDLLEKYFGVKGLPVFITETGWAHAEGVNYKKEYLDVYKVADNFVWAFENVWLKDEKVVAVTPFTIRYSPPYDHFSWIDWEEKPYPQFKAIQEMEKTEGKPPYLIKEETICSD